VICLHAAGKDAAAEEQKLSKILDRPNLHVNNVKWTEIEEWLGKTRTPEARRNSIRKVLAALRRPSKELTTAYYPLKTGASWTYKGPEGQEATGRVTGRVAVGERDYYKLVFPGGNEEYLAVEPDGVYRQMLKPEMTTPHLRILALPAKVKDTWVIKSRQGKVLMAGRASTRVEDVTVPAGKFFKTLVVELRMTAGGIPMVSKTWYARNVGPVKVVLEIGLSTTKMELVKYTPGKAEERK
jgi:hypothetical protein